jgi:hypothetical protein
MDLPLLWAVVRRFKWIAIGGTLLAVILAALAYKTPTLSGHVVYQSQPQLLISQGGLPYGRAGNEYLPGSLPGAAKTGAVVVGDPSYMASLSPVYAALANSDVVKEAIRASHIPGTVTATEDIDPQTGAYTPLFSLTSSAPTASKAVALSGLAIRALQNWLTAQQAATGTPANQRVVLEVLQNGIPPTARGHKPTIPILLFVAVLAATIVLLLSLENKDRKTSIALGRIPAFGHAAVGVEPRWENGHHHVADLELDRLVVAPAPIERAARR